METTRVRVERTWQKTKNWVANFDGSATEVFLTNIPAESLPQAFQTLAGQAKDFRVSIVTGETGEESVEVPLDSLPTQLARLRTGEILDISMNFTASLAKFDLDLHCIVHLLRTGMVALELVWWSDQVFTEGTDAFVQFEAALEYFISLQELFNAEMLFIGAENLDRPGPESINWTQI